MSDPPKAVADRTRALRRPLLVGLDVDGVLAPIVGHADDARLLDGMIGAITRLAGQPGIDVAIVSGRAIDDLSRFGFPEEVIIVGSHGMQHRDRAMAPLDDIERARLAELERLAENAAETAGAGAWVEHKPASAVLHVRQADVDRGRAAVEQLTAAASEVAGATSKPGIGVLELFTRAASKGAALLALKQQLDAASVVFVGDDHTDEEAFAVLGSDDLAIKVGTAPTIARMRLAGPTAVLVWLGLVVD